MEPAGKGRFAIQSIPEGIKGRRDRMLLKDILPVLCGPATLCEETEDHVHFRDLFSGYIRDIPEEFLKRTVCTVRGYKRGEGELDIILKREGKA